jgi:general stress protein CsbA
MIFLKVCVGSLVLLLLTVALLILCSWVGPLFGTYIAWGIPFFMVSWVIGDLVLGYTCEEKKAKDA